MNVEVFCFDAVAPVRERGLKWTSAGNQPKHRTVAPVRERGLKYFDGAGQTGRSIGRSREGAWIEIEQSLVKGNWDKGRSREGAWIEMLVYFSHIITSLCRSREGAWIEIMVSRRPMPGNGVAPVRERGLKSELIEASRYLLSVAPVRERGLK